MAILTISGPDGCGKTTLAKALSKEFNIPHLSHEFANPSYNSVDQKVWNSIVYGINLALANTYAKLDNFIKDRYSLDEFVYQKQQNRPGFNWRKMDLAGIEKQYLILLDVSYEKYLSNIKDRSEKVIPQKLFENTNMLFAEAFDKSAVISKIVICNDGSFDQTLEIAKTWFLQELNSSYRRVQRDVMSCKRCKLIKQCEQCNPEYARPIIPTLPHNDIKSLGKIENLFLGVAPGRAKNIPFSIQSFTHSSGNFLNRALIELKIYDKSAISNVVKCNTPVNKLFPPLDVQTCVHTFLFDEIQMFPKLKNIFVLGYQAFGLLSNVRINCFEPGEVDDDMFFDSIKRCYPDVKITRIIHPSSFNYSFSEEKFERWKNSIRVKV